MFKSKGFFWQFYLLLIVLQILYQSIIFFSADSRIYLYYMLLKSFDPVFHFKYIANYVQIGLNIIHMIVLGLFVYNIRLLWPIVWRILFILKIGFDVIGHSYEAKEMISLMHSDLQHFLITILIMVIFYFPAYYGCFQYAFKETDKWSTPSH